ncbi:MAG: NAD-dependent epimerase/dehydratase family protein [Deltaproteobacteria bacterium]|nr:NAD-dependent epimerase/dehydratase family protein [Deltaproteobacteria bacterium]
MKETILVTGGAGEIGSRLVAKLLGRGFRVRALLLPNDERRDRLEGLDCEIVEGDITSPTSLHEALRGVHTIYHLAAVLLVEDRQLFSAVNVVGTAHMLAAASQAGVNHFVHVSSASVVYPITTPYSRSKRAAERLVARASGLEHVTIVRPTLVYDGEGGLEFSLFSSHVQRFPLVPLVGHGGAMKRPVHVDDLLSGLAAIAGNARSYGKTYNLSGSETVSIRDLATLIAKRNGWRRRFVPLPVNLCRAGAHVLSRAMGRSLLAEHTLVGLTQDAALDCEAAERDLGYAPVGVRRGLGINA